MARKATNPNETPAQKFIRLANVRVNKMISAYRQLGQLSAKQYVSTTEQIKQINETLQTAHDRTIDTLNRKPVASSDFKLK